MARTRGGGCWARKVSQTSEESAPVTHGFIVDVFIEALHWTSSWSKEWLCGVALHQRPTCSHKTFRGIDLFSLAVNARGDWDGQPKKQGNFLYMKLLLRIILNQQNVELNISKNFREDKREKGRISKYERFPIFCIYAQPVFTDLYSNTPILRTFMGEEDGNRQAPPGTTHGWHYWPDTPRPSLASGACTGRVGGSVARTKDRKSITTRDFLFPCFYLFCGTPHVSAQQQLNSRLQQTNISLM